MSLMSLMSLISPPALRAGPADAADSELAHIAAHGTFRADSPLFSSLRMADGPIVVHDFERLDRSPYRIILSCCGTALLASVGADELLGLVTALLPLGTAGVVACSAPVNDAAVLPLMLALHKGLGAGLSLAEALRDARAALPGDALHQATGWAFSTFGAAWRVPCSGQAAGPGSAGAPYAKSLWAGWACGTCVSQGRAPRSLAPRRA